MEEMGEMAVSAYERVKEKTEAMSDAIYAALDAIDAYKVTVDAISAEQGDVEEANIGLAKRMKQFSSRADAMVTAIEDGVLDHLNFCADRVFSVDLAERGEFI
jgi:phosphoribosylformimino-5-aminoimidazole carboxamide ribonucleotide (ProFAR) isomerase